MSNETLFYICGIALAVSAVLVSVVGLKAKDFPGRAFPAVFLWFAILVGATTTFAVLHGKDEDADKAKAAEYKQAGEQFEADRNEVPAPSGGSAAAGETGKAEAKPTAKGPGGTLQLAANPTAIAYDKTKLASKPGKVTIDFTNPAAIEHDVAIEGPEGKQIATSALVAKGKTSVSADLPPGTYHYYCTVPGHREAGMEGTLVVK